MGNERGRMSNGNIVRWGGITSKWEREGEGRERGVGLDRYRYQVSADTRQYSIGIGRYLF